MTVAPESRDAAERWRALVRAVLDRAGTPYPPAEPEAALERHTDENLVVRALYTAADLAAIDLPRREWPARDADRADADRADADQADAGWDVRQRHGGPDPVEVNRAVLADLANGVTSVWLVVGGSGPAPADLARALAGVDLAATPVVLDAGAQTLAAGAALLALLAERGVGAAARGSLGADPVGAALRTGTAPDLAVAVESLGRARNVPGLHAITVDATIYHDAGAGEADEVAVATSVALAYLRAAMADGLDMGDVLGAIEFRFAVTDDQFLAIAKLRAARWIWSRVAELCGAPEHRRAQHQHAVTSAAMMTRRDPWVNMLRTTVAAVAAATAGADAITVAPFDSAIGASDAFARRIARNTHAVLHDEAGLARVADPGAGSFYVESLTAQLAAAAWDRFTALERAGGAGHADAVAELLAPTRVRRAAAIARRQRPITGVTHFPYLDEVPVTRPAFTPSAAGAAPSAADEVPVGALPGARYAAPFEALRERSDEIRASTGHRPVVLLAIPTSTIPTSTIPAPAGLAAPNRSAMFAAEVFGSGGIESALARGTSEELQAAFSASGAAVACICAPSDPVPAGDAIGACISALRTAGARLVWQVGRPAEPAPAADADRSAGADGFLDAGDDLLAVLGHTYDAIAAPGHTYDAIGTP